MNAQDSSFQIQAFDKLCSWGMMSKNMREQPNSQE